MKGTWRATYGDEVYLPVTPRDESPVMYVLLRTQESTQQAACGAEAGGGGGGFAGSGDAGANAE